MIKITTNDILHIGLQRNSGSYIGEIYEITCPSCNDKIEVRISGHPLGSWRDTAAFCKCRYKWTVLPIAFGSKPSVIDEDSESPLGEER